MVIVGMLFLPVLLLAVVVSGHQGVRDSRRKLVESNNAPYDCTWNGAPMCCAVLNHTYPRSRVMDVHSVDHHCVLHKAYMPSPYELAHLEIARQWLSLPADDQLKAFIDYIVRDIPHSNVWLGRVEEHMQGSHEPVITEDDRAYLSYFNITRVCHHHDKPKISSSWVEWIEPLTVHGRHPFSLMSCRKIAANYSKHVNETLTGMVSITNVDHILLKSGHRLEDIVRLTGKRTSVLPKHFFFDVGANKFQSGLKYFLCAYLQRKIVFDDIYGWELTTYNSTEYWNDVPPQIVPAFHFYNVGITADNASTHSVTRFIRQTVREHDFVSFKLDIDTPSIELPIAMELLSDHSLGSLVDEFFFELHFRCEVMMRCGFGRNISEEMHGFKMVRHDVLKFFHDLRVQGIRAHLWP